MNLKGLILAATLAAAGLTATPAAALKVGSNDVSNCFPFACNDGATSFDFYQIYSKGAFDGALTFNTITFSSWSDYPDEAPQFLKGDYVISFGVTQDPVGTTGLVSPSGAPVFYDGKLGGADLSIKGHEFSYDPGLGKNLVMWVHVSGQDATANPGLPSFAADTSILAEDHSLAPISRGGWARFADPNDDYELATDGALVTAFSTTEAGSVPGGVPEPGAWALMIMGFGFAGGALRARRRSSALTA